jgi:hypothetical protein
MEGWAASPKPILIQPILIPQACLIQIEVTQIEATQTDLNRTDLNQMAFDPMVKQSAGPAAEMTIPCSAAEVRRCQPISAAPGMWVQSLLTRTWRARKIPLSGLMTEAHELHSDRA